MFVNMNFRKIFTTLFYRNQKALEKKIISIHKIIRNVYDVAHSKYSPSMAEKFSPRDILKI